MSIILFFVVLFVLVLVHEWGHFIVAKKTGMQVDEFGIGFPPKLYGVKKGETEYTLNALPLGGFVRIWGENYEDQYEEGTRPAVVHTDASRAFSARPKWAQALVLIAGVTMNILFAWLLFSVTYFVGVPTVVDEANASQDAELVVAGVLPDGPAAKLPAGSIIVSATAGDETLTHPTPTSFSSLIEAVAPEAVTVSYKPTRDAAVVETTLTPVQGLIADNPNRYLVGVSLSLVELKRSGFFSAIGEGAQSTWYGLIGIAGGLWHLISDSFMGEADFSQVAGPVGIVGMVGQAAQYGFTALLTFTAVISLNLAVINLLPFPALDGGRLVFVAIEAVTRKKIPPVWAGRVNLIGFAILMLLMIAVTYSDIAKLL